MAAPAITGLNNPSAAAGIYPALMTCTRKWSRLRAWGGSVAKRRGMKRGTVAVARPAVIMHRSSVTGDEFDFGGPAVAAMAA